MNGLRLTAIEGGRVQLSDIDWLTAACLLEVPAVLPQARSGEARDRLFPKPSATDASLNEDWAHYVTPELETLFAGAGDILARDIQPLAESKDPLRGRSLTFPLNHCEAWISAINQARLILGALYQVSEKDMDEREFADPDNPKQQAVFRIHVLGYVLEIFVQFLAGAK